MSSAFLQRISRLYPASHAAELGFTLPEFCELLIDITQRSLGESCTEREQARFAEGLHLEDLVLARACARGNELAWERFVAGYRDKLYVAAAVISREEYAARELADSLYGELFATRVRNDGQRTSKLEAYSGRGSLEGWLRTVLAQEYVNRFRRQRKLVSFEETLDSGANARTGSESYPYVEQLRIATDAALMSLSSDERLLLSAYYLDGRTLAEIGRMLGVHESTVSRRLEKITATLRKRIVARLRSAGLSKAAAQEALGSDVRDIGIDVRNRLTQERQA